MKLKHTTCLLVLSIAITLCISLSVTQAQTLEYRYAFIGLQPDSDPQLILVDPIEPGIFDAITLPVPLERSGARADVRPSAGRGSGNKAAG